MYREIIIKIVKITVYDAVLLYTSYSMLKTITKIKDRAVNKVTGFRNRYIEKLELDELIPSRIEYDDQTGMFLNYDHRVYIRYYSANVHERIKLCEIEYGTKSGNIGTIEVSPEFRRRGLGKQMLDIAIADIKASGTREVYAMAKEGHSFWTGVYGRDSRRMPSDPRNVQVTGYVTTR